MQDIRVTTLDNGLRVATDSRPDVASVALGVYVGVGTRHEPAELNGIAHMLEHMAFKGTESRSAYDIAREIEDVGGYINAFTSREMTAYYLRLLAEDLPLGVDLLADIMLNSTFEAEELERERSVILQELGQAQDTPDDIIFDHFQATAFPGQSIGRPILGEAEIIRAISRDQLHAYMKHHYQPERMVVSAAGRVDHEAFVEQVARAFEKLRPEPRELVLEGARYSGGEYRESKKLEQVHLLLGFPGIAQLDDEVYDVNLLATLLGGGMSSRLFQEVREKRGLVYSIYAFHSAYQDGGLFGIYAGTGEEETAELLPVICEQLAEVAESADQEELERARAQLRSSLLMALESSSQRCEGLAKQLLTRNRVLTPEEMLGKLEAVQLADIKALAARLSGAEPTLAGIGPLSKLESFDSLRARLVA
jgi:predicted Zn-dependent peptidase